MNRSLSLLAILLFTSFFSFSEVVPKTYRATFTNSPIKIDGKNNDEAWIKAEIAKDFTALDPVEGAAPTQQTEVRVMYDNSAVYLIAKMYDSHPDSILHELGNRDEASELNSDSFRFGFDPYNKRQGGYVFEVTASGVQNESFNDDLTFDAVWQSAVVLEKDGWTVEIKIPYSAIRFPKADVQVWGVQFARFIRRNREYDQWTLTPKKVQNRMSYWGTMNGIENIQPPLRLNLTPYLSVYGENTPRYENGEHVGYDRTIGYSGGADLKYGIDERFTLDMTLLPDFSQVKSDSKVKNLSAFETIYSENRPFFKEGTSLFNKGNLLYTRRIGRTPSLFFDVPYLLEEGEVVEKNPDKARLVNATKVSGRTNGGLGIGILNAITGNTYATIKKADGSKREILTEPLTNYSIIVLDQQLKHNSSVFVSNANTTRDGKARDANVTAAEFRLEDKSNTVAVRSGGTFTHIAEWNENKSYKDGYLGFISIDKIKGSHQYGASYELADKKFDKNDLSYNFYRDYTSQFAYYTYYAYNPFWKYFKQGNATAYISRNGILSKNDQTTSLNMAFNYFLLFNSNWSIFMEVGGNPSFQRDYYEPRAENRFVKIPSNLYGNIYMSTNYNKRLAFDFGGHYNQLNDWNFKSWGYFVYPIFRFSDKLKFKMENNLDIVENDRGFTYVDDLSGEIYFGQRRIITVVNALNARYLVKNDMSITLTTRHYWSQGKYNAAFLLDPNGELVQLNTTQSNTTPFDFNSSYFTLDLVYSWQFAPGSSFIATFKNVINSDDGNTRFDYFSNLNRSFNAPQSNGIYLKFLYYLDYQYLIKKKA